MNTLTRVVLIAGAAVAVIAGSILLRGPTPLPACDSADTLAVLRTLAAQDAPGLPPGPLTARSLETSFSVTDISETAFDEAKQERQCRGALNFNSGGIAVHNNRRIVYTLTWSDREKAEFEVFAKAEKPPA